MIEGIFPYVPVEGASTNVVWPSERLAQATRRQGGGAAYPTPADSYAFSQEAVAAARGERDARSMGEPLSYAGLFTSSRAGGIASPVVLPNGAVWPSAPGTGNKAAVAAGPEPAEGTDSRINGKPGQAGGGAEARSSERSFFGGLAENKEAGAEASGQEGTNDSSEADAFARLTDAEQREVEELKLRDQEVRTHEQAHIGASGGLAQGGASFETTTGPDGKTYAVGGEVQIDTSEAATPEATITKAQRVRAAALAPAQPSGQDMQVAARASQMEAEARREKISAVDGRQAEGAGATEGTDPAAVPGAEGAAYAGRAAARAADAYARVSDIPVSATLEHSFSLAV